MKNLGALLESIAAPERSAIQMYLHNLPTKSTALQHCTWLKKKSSFMNRFIIPMESLLSKVCHYFFDFFMFHYYAYACTRSSFLSCMYNSVTPERNLSFFTRARTRTGYLYWSTVLRYDVLFLRVRICNNVVENKCQQATRSQLSFQRRRLFLDASVDRINCASRSYF